MKVHLLFEAADFDFAAGLPPGHEDLTQDLELATLIQAMAAGDRYLTDVATRVLLTSLHDPAAIRYRQAILTDCLAHPEVIRDLYAIATGAQQDKRTLWSHYGGTYQNPGSNLNGAVTYLEAYVARLRELRAIADTHYQEFRSAGLTTLFATLRSDLDDAYFAEVSDHLQRLRFRAGVVISAELDRDNSGINFVLRDPGAARRNWIERLGIGPRSSHSFTISARDEAGAQILADLTDRGINQVANAAAQSADHIGGYLAILRAELGFYVACLNLAGQLATHHVPITIPEPVDADSLAFSCEDLRDTCLALRSPDPVTGNDITADGVSLVVITGANSGGKSTFLRSAGQAQLMMQCGLFVTAQNYQANVAGGIFTHFIREEDASMTSGRLDDELKRMSATASHLTPHSLMLFNESFAGTNEREGAEIGHQIVRALQERRITVFYVTHRYEFTQRFTQQPTALFLRADRQPGQPPDHKLAPKQPLPTSSGQDLYHQLGGWLGEDDHRVPAAAPPAGGGT